MSIIIHIGMQKTGTTFLQKVLFEGRGELLKHKILYPHPIAGLPGDDRANAHHWLAHAIVDSRKLYTPAADFSLLKEHVDGLNKEHALHPEATAVISSEGFSEFTAPAIARLRQLFPSPDTRILVYLRRQDLWLDSYYAQLAKVGRDVSPEVLLRKERWRLNYFSWLESWARHFGSGNIIVRTYENFGPDNSIWEDFCGAIGRPGAAGLKPVVDAVNQSLSYELTLFSKNQHIYGDQRTLRHVLDKLNGHFQHRPGLKYLSRKLAERTLEASAETNQCVAQKYLGRDRLFQDETISCSSGDGSLSVDQLSQVVGGISISLLGRMAKQERRIRNLETELASARTRFPLLYATRSLLPSPTANSVQSTHMACALDKIHPDFTAVYRSSPESGSPETDFAAYGLNPPRRAQPLRAFRPWLDWTHPDLPAFRAVLRRKPANTIVYTRSTRLSWVAASRGLVTFIELHDPLTPVRTAWLRHLLKTHRLPGLVATTKRLKADLLAALPSLSSERVLVAGGAASAALLDLLPIKLPQAGAFNVGYGGSAFCGKGIEILLACAARAPRMAFHLIGPDKAACARIGVLSPNVIFHGRKSHPETLGLLKSMDALMLPNQRSVIIRSGADIGAHTSPLKLFEYLATGRPIVASGLPVFSEVLRDGENALLAPPEDVDGFCQHLHRLERESNLRHLLGAQARLDFAANYTWDHRAKRILKFITESASVAA